MNCVEEVKVPLSRTKWLHNSNQNSLRRSRPFNKCIFSAGVQTASFVHDQLLHMISYTASLGWIEGHKRKEASILCLSLRDFFNAHCVKVVLKSSPVSNYFHFSLSKTSCLIGLKSKIYRQLCIASLESWKAPLRDWWALLGAVLSLQVCLPPNVELFVRRHKTHTHLSIYNRGKKILWWILLLAPSLEVWARTCACVC